MKTVRVNVTAEDIEAAEEVYGRMDWWQWPVKRALEGLIGESVDIDHDLPQGYMATVGPSDDQAVLVLSLDASAEAWLDARWDRGQAGEPFFFELSLPDWLVALVDR